MKNDYIKPTIQEIRLLPAQLCSASNQKIPFTENETEDEFIDG